MKQIRAGHLSGDCHYKRELLRGFMKLRGHEQVRFFVFILNNILDIQSSFTTLLPSLLDHNIELSLFAYQKQKNIELSLFIILAIFSILMSAKAKTFGCKLEAKKKGLKLLCLWGVRRFSKNKVC